jgi:hypothetical protein
MILAGYTTLNTTVAIEAGAVTVYSTGLVPAEKTPGFGVFLAVLSILAVFMLWKTRLCRKS